MDDMKTACGVRGGGAKRRVRGERACEPARSGEGGRRSEQRQHSTTEHAAELARTHSHLVQLERGDLGPRTRSVVRVVVNDLVLGAELGEKVGVDVLVVCAAVVPHQVSRR